MTSLRKRRNPSSIDACRTLVTSLENATSGELASLRTSAANTGSGRIRSHSSRKEASVPDTTFRALNATRGKGGRLSSADSISSVSTGLGGLATRVPIIKKTYRSGRTSHAARVGGRRRHPQGRVVTAPNCILYRHGESKLRVTNGHILTSRALASGVAKELRVNRGHPVYEITRLLIFLETCACVGSPSRLIR